MNTQAVWLHSLSSQLHELLSHWCLTYSGSLMHDGGMNGWGVEVCDAEAVRPDYGLINSSESSDPWFRQNRDGWGKEISPGSHFYLYQTHDFNVLQFIRDYPGGSGHPLTCRRTCVTNSWKRGEHYQVKNNEVFRRRVFLLIYTHRSVSSIKKAMLTPSSTLSCSQSCGRCRRVEAELSAYSVLQCVSKIRFLCRENMLYWGICFTQPWAPQLC